MGKVVRGLIAAAVLGAAAAGAQPPPGEASPGGLMLSNPWSPDLASAYRKALAEHRPMVVAFVREDSDPSRQLQVEVFDTAEFLNAAAGTALVRLAVRADGSVAGDDADGNARRLIAQLAIRDLPAVAVLDAHAGSLNERGRIAGRLPLEKFLAQLSGLLASPEAGGTRSP
jgi:hypothetical protein